MLENIVKTIEMAIVDGRTDVMLSLIENYGKSEDVDGEKIPLKSFLNSCLTDSGSFLHLATELNQADIARTLLLSGSDPCFRNAAGQTAVALAATPQMISVYEQELFRHTALSDTLKIGELLSAGIDVNCQDSQLSGNRPLHWAAAYADLTTVSFLLDNGADVNAVNCHGATALCDAVLRGNTRIIEELIRHGADPAIKATTGKFANQSALDLATSNPEVLLALRDSFVMTSPLMDAELHSDSSSSWVNSYGSCESLTALDDVATSPSVPDLDVVISDEVALTHSSPLAAIHPNRPRPKLNYNFQQKLKLLWPVPRRLHVVNGEAKMDRNLAVYIVDSSVQGGANVHEMMKPWHLAATRLEKAGYTYSFKGRWHTIGIPSNVSGVFCQVGPCLLPCAVEAYSISVAHSQIRIIAGDMSGLSYAVSFLVQFLTLFSNHDLLPCINVMDWPMWKCRGTVISLSLRQLALNVGSVRHLIDLLASLRLSHLFLLDMLVVDRTPDAVSPSELLSLEKYCSDRCITLSPAVDIETTDSMSLEHFYVLLSDRLSQLSSRSYVYFGPVATEFLLKHATASNRFPDLPVVSDTLLILDQSASAGGNSGISPLLLPMNAILLLKCEHLDNNEDVDVFKQSITSRRSACGVMLSTSFQKSVTGCLDLIFPPFHRVSHLLTDSDVAAFLLSDATLVDSLTLHAFQLPGLAFGAGVAWNPNTKLVDTMKAFPEVLDAHVFNTTGLGAVVSKLNRAESTLGCNATGNGASLAYQLIFEPDNTSLDGFTLERLQRFVRDIKLCVATLPASKSNDSLVQLVVDEVNLTADILLFSCRICRSLLVNGQNPNRGTGLSIINVGISNLPPTNRTDLANRLLELGQRYQKVALRANTSSGLRGSVRILNQLFHKLIPHIESSDIITI